MSWEWDMQMFCLHVFKERFQHFLTSCINRHSKERGIKNHSYLAGISYKNYNMKAYLEKQILIAQYTKQLIDNWAIIVTKTHGTYSILVF